MRVCLECGKEFKNTSRNQKFCVRECFLKYSFVHRKMYDITYRRNNPYVKKVFVERDCEICGTAFMPKTRSHSMCSQRCRNKKLNQNRSDRPKRRNHKWIIEKVVCEHCGYDIKAALHAHHLSKERTDVIVLCANCHYIFHTLVGSKFRITTKEECKNILDNYIRSLKAIKLV